MVELSQLIVEGPERCGSAALEELCGRVVPVEELELVYGLVRAQKPHLVLDANTGSGLVAAAIACALEKNGRGALWSFARKDDAAAAAELWSSLGLRNRIQLHVEPLALFLKHYTGTWLDLLVSDGARDAELEQILERGLLEGLLVVRGDDRPCHGRRFSSTALSSATSVARVTRGGGGAAPPTTLQRELESHNLDGAISLALLENLTPEALESAIDFSRLNEPARRFLPAEHVAYLNDPAGREHYKFLAFLAAASQGKTVLDIGTLHGTSALALSYGSKRVVSFDVARDHRFPATWGAIEFVQGNMLDPGSARDRFVHVIRETRLVLLDVNPHDGEKEQEFLHLLEAAEFEGCVVLDDIHLNARMERFWGSITRPKVDLTACGHTTGTGCVLFQGEDT